MSKQKETYLLKEILKEISELHSLAEFKEFGLSKENALKQLRAITKNIQDNFKDYINLQ